MKILFITKGGIENYTECCLFHGLVDLGHDVVDSTYLWYMSRMDEQKKKTLYGNGFTIFGLLPDRSMINRNDIQRRIREKEFDCVIYGNGTIRGNSLIYLDDVLSSYPKNKIAICDGGDESILEHKVIDKVIYFKRELRSDEAYPISYAIPEEKIRVDASVKTRDVAFIIPGNRSTYIYNDEKSYYDGYAESRFGITCRKCGWDCLRHYEIIANRCLPYFKEFYNCPRWTMSNWPRDLQYQANQMFESRDFERYDQLLEEFFSYAKRNLTTKALANYVLRKLDVER